MKQIVCCLLYVLSLAPPAASLEAQSFVRVEPRSSQVDALFDGWVTARTPGCAVGVVERGEWVHKAGYGLANLDYDIPLSSSSVFRLASAGKQFTALLVLQLVEEGKVSLDDPVRLYVPELAPRQPEPTLRHLLEHTAGYREYLDLLVIAHHKDGEIGFYGLQEAMHMITRQRGESFAAGSAFGVSDTGYLLLGEIVRRVMQRSLHDLAEEKIFGPLGMTSSHAHDDARRVVKGRVLGYRPDPDDGFRVSLSGSDVVGDGGYFSTVDDVYLWLKNFQEPRVGTRAIFDRMENSATSYYGVEIRHGYGLHVATYRGMQQVGHSGGWMGFQTMIARYPAADLDVICLCNRSDAAAQGLTNRIADIYLADFLEPLPRIEVSREELSAAAGIYRSPLIGLIMELKAEADGLAVGFALTEPRWHLAPVGEGDFMGSRRQVTFLDGSAGQRVLYHHASGHYILFDRIEVVENQDPRPYAGRYDCDELGVTLEVAPDAGGLHLVGDPEKVYRPTSRHSFVHPGKNWTLDFTLDADGRVTEMRAGTGHLLGVPCRPVDDESVAKPTS